MELAPEQAPEQVAEAEDVDVEAQRATSMDSSSVGTDAMGNNGGVFAAG